MVVVMLSVPAVRRRNHLHRKQTHESIRVFPNLPPTVLVCVKCSNKLYLSVNALSVFPTDDRSAHQ